MTKDDIRKEMKRARREITDREKKSLAAARALLSTSEYRSAESVMLYCPLGSEVDTAYIADAARADGKKVLYPVTDEASGVITPILVDKDTEFLRGAFGIKEPLGEVYNGDIDLVVVPGVAFDREGGRLGFGKGCYDGFLSSISTIKVGLCYDIQLIEKLPSEEHDVRMDMIVSENEIIKIKKNA